MLAFYRWSKEKLNEDGLNLFFTKQDHKDGAIWRRNRKLAGARFLRIVFPRFWVTAKEKMNKTRFSLKPDGWASLFYVVFIVVSLTSIFDQENWPADQPRWAPFVALGWYVTCAIFEVVKTKQIFEKVS